MSVATNELGGRIDAYLEHHGPTAGPVLCEAFSTTPRELAHAFSYRVNRTDGDDPSSRIVIDGAELLDGIYYLEADDDTSDFSEHSDGELRSEAKTAKASTKGARAPQRRGLLPGEWSYAKAPRAIFRDPDLPMAAKMAACALADALNVNGRTNAARVIKISYDALAAKMGANRETARVGITRLVAAGWVTKATGKGHGANRYRFTAKVRD